MRYTIIFFAISLLLLSFKNSLAQSTPKLVTTVEGIKEYELDNGLRILLIPDASQTNIAINIVYKVGSRHEGYGETGMAHLLEHMLFKQCEKFTDIKKAIADKGASANGTTWYDRTNYYEILSASDENLSWAIDMEADRMIHSKILPEELAKEFSVVRNEFEIGENYPSNVLNERILSTMYLWHNYGKSTIGSKEDIERVKADNLRAFYKKYYQPDNAVLVIAGKFDEKKALGYVKQFFGPIPKPSRVLQPTYTVEPPQDGERNVELRRAGDIQYIGMAYHTPSVADKEYAANDALVEILTNDPSGVFYKKLVETKLASKLFGYSQTLHDPGYTYFQVEVPKDKSLDSAKWALLHAADDIPAMNITEEDLARAKNNRIKFLENTINRTIDLAIALTEAIGAGDWRLWYWYRDQLEKLTVADIKEAAKRYYKTSNRTYGVFIPEATTPDRTRVDETPDVAKLLDGYKGKAVAAQKADFENSIENIRKNAVYGKLSNGGKYVLLEKPTKGDKINARISLRMGDENSLMNKNEIAQVTATLLKTGTTTRTKKQITDELDRIKTDISIFGNATGIVISVSTDKQNLPAAIALLDDILHHPKFDAAEFDKVILDTRANYEANRNEPFNAAFTKLQKITTKYPKGHPLYAADVDESLQDLKKIKLEDVKKFYADFYGANNSVSSFVGEIDKKQVTDFLQNSFGKWNSKMPYKAVEPKYFDVPATIESIATPDKTNAALIGNINLNISEKHADYPALFMANELLGGGAFLSSRIPQRLRENEGMSYGAGTFINSEYKYDVTNWGLYAAYNPIYRGRLDSALRQEVDKAIAAGFTEDELKNSVKAWLEQNKTSLGDNAYLADLLRVYLRDDRNLDDYTGFEARVKALNLATVNAAMRKYFDKSKLVLIFSGDFQKKAF
ncbi:MAG TPA: pitrilysin family protein [Chitinophagaceae bacterium]|nr:pitrilysin family protein [Chitinophagaceae bacterium]